MRRVRLKVKERNVLRELDRVRRSSGPTVEIAGLAQLLGRTPKEITAVCRDLADRDLVQFDSKTAVRATDLGRKQVQ